MPHPFDDTQKPTVLQTFVRLVRSYFNDDLAKSSAELSYYLLFSIFPLLLIVSSLLSVTKVSQTTLLHLLSVLPGEIQRVISPVITRYFGNISYETFLWRISGFIVLGIFFLSRTMSSLIHNVNRIYHMPQQRGGLGQLLFEVLAAAGFIVAIVCSFVLMVLGRGISAIVNKYIEIPQQLMWIMNGWTYGRYLFAIAVVFFFVLLLYYLTPNCKMRLRDALPGAIFALLMWMVCTMLFTFYVNNISRYDVLYGSISAIMVLLLWMYMTGIIVYLGFELNFILMQQHGHHFICKGKPWYMRLGIFLYNKFIKKCAK